MIESSKIFTQSGLNLDSLLSQMMVDLDYVRYLPVSFYSITAADFTSTSDMETYEPLSELSVTKLSHHAPNILPAPTDDNLSLTLYRYYRYIIYFASTLRIINATTHAGAYINTGIRFRDITNSVNYDRGFLSSSVPSSVTGGYFDLHISNIAVIEPPTDTALLQILIHTGLSSYKTDTTYINNKGIVIAIPREGVV